MWFRSSYSNGAGGECVECAISADLVLVRDSKVAEGTVVVRGDAWRCFLPTLRNEGRSSRPHLGGSDD
ncbi:DUF397 domain-containing protein [Streptomyces sp. DSM 3412]|uniref:DUF397 domain-containing protein n=1 Tax=Streptomyces gottesmaniae TaxID=3075518 RepID=A0ABU2Z8D9_9ACTN|nr:DUF397 domain-containing protein [Streptomyces sp. DSM 3412]MDT0572862.1 DUF397 domain-containing protein [Streptomyces sp. DSM 3412]